MLRSSAQKVGTDVGQFSVFVDGSDPSRPFGAPTVWDPDGRTVVAPAVDDRPFLYLQEPDDPGQVPGDVALGPPGLADRRVDGWRGVQTDGSLRRPLLHGRRVPPARDEERSSSSRCCSGPRGSSTPSCSRACCVDRPARDRGRATDPHRDDQLLLFGLLVPRAAGRVAGRQPTRSLGLLGRPAVRSLAIDARVLPDLRREPDLRGAVQGYGGPHGRVRRRISWARCWEERSNICRCSLGSARSCSSSPPCTWSRTSRGLGQARLRETL